MSRFKVNDMIDDIVNDYRKQVAQALKRAEQKVKVRMQEIIQEYMLDNYYNGYTPKMYVRIYQLQKSVGPYTELKDFNNIFALGFGIEDDEPYGYSAMDHSKYQIKVTYQRKKKSGVWEKTYEYEDDNVNEEYIFENFLAGIHPNVGPAGTSNISERVNKALDYFLDFEVIDIVNKELDRIK